MKSLIVGLALIALAGCATQEQVDAANAEINSDCAVATAVAPLLAPSDAVKVAQRCAAAEALEPIVGPALVK